MAVLAVVTVALGATGIVSIAGPWSGRAVPAPQSSSKGIGPSTSPSTPQPAKSDPGYAFIGQNLLGDPIGWDPCATITYALDLRQAPAYATTDAAEAFDRVAEASSLEFASMPIGDGSLKATYARMLERERGVDDLSPDIVLVWTSHARYQRLRDVYDLKPSIATTLLFSTAGMQSRLVGGIVLVDRRATSPGGFEGWWSHGPTLLHELGHAMGLAHVDDRGQIMCDGRRPLLTLTDWGPGDLDGLGWLGRNEACP